MESQPSEILKSAAPEKPPKIETAVEKVGEEIIRAQKIVGAPLQLDQLILEYSNDPIHDWSTPEACLIRKGIHWSYINCGRNPNPDAKFLQSTPSNDELEKISHELTHLITNETVFKGNYPINVILAEGISIGVEIESINSHLPENEKLNPEEIRTHCQRIVEEKKDYFLNPEKIVGPNDFPNPNTIYSMALESHYRLEFDGFKLKRSYRHIAGISFVLGVLKDELWKWPVLFKNPPTMEEIVHPPKYIERVGKELDSFQAQETQSKLPEINERLII